MDRYGGYIDFQGRHRGGRNENNYNGGDQNNNNGGNQNNNNGGNEKKNNNNRGGKFQQALAPKFIPSDRRNNAKKRNYDEYSKIKQQMRNENYKPPLNHEYSRNNNNDTSMPPKREYSRSLRHTDAGKSHTIPPSNEYVTFFFFFYHFFFLKKNL